MIFMNTLLICKIMFLFIWTMMLMIGLNLIMMNMFFVVECLTTNCLMMLLHSLYLFSYVKYHNNLGMENIFKGEGNILEFFYYIYELVINKLNSLKFKFFILMINYNKFLNITYSKSFINMLTCNIKVMKILF